MTSPVPLPLCSLPHLWHIPNELSQPSLKRLRSRDLSPEAINEKQRNETARRGGDLFDQEHLSQEALGSGRGEAYFQNLDGAFLISRVRMTVRKSSSYGLQIDN